MYDAELYTPATARGLAGRVVTTARRVAAAPDEPLTPAAGGTRAFAGFRLSDPTPSQPRRR
jgi:hypothetical protein